MKPRLLILILFIGLSFTSFAQTGLDQGDTKYIKTYPNPASAVVNFKFQKPNANSRFYSLRVLNSIGKQVFGAKNIPSLLSIDLREEKFYRGMYIYQLLDNNGLVVESGKIFVVN